MLGPANSRGGWLCRSSLLDSLGFHAEAKELAERLKVSGYTDEQVACQKKADHNMSHFPENHISHSIYHTHLGENMQGDSRKFTARAGTAKKRDQEGERQFLQAGLAPTGVGVYWDCMEIRNVEGFVAWTLQD